MDAFDADVLIYAVDEHNVRGGRVARLFNVAGTAPVGTGSKLLIPEVLIRPLRMEARVGRELLNALLARLRLRDVDADVAGLATSLGAKYRLKTVDAIHLATAVLDGADRFITNNRRDFDQAVITEIDIIYPEDLATPDGTEGRA